MLRDVGPEIKLIRLRGNGANFCKGRQAPQIDREKSTALDLRHPVAEVPLALYAAVKEARAPTLAIVQGEALGVGCALAAVCDLTIAADDAIFQVPELDHNIAPTLVMWALINRASYKTTAHLVFTRERVTARHAEALGLVTKVVAPANAGERSRGTHAVTPQPRSRLAAGDQGIPEVREPHGSGERVGILVRAQRRGHQLGAARAAQITATIVLPISWACACITCSSLRGSQPFRRQTPENQPTSGRFSLFAVGTALEPLGLPMDASLNIVIVDESPVRAAILEEGLREAGYVNVVRIEEHRATCWRASTPSIPTSF